MARRWYRIGVLATVTALVALAGWFAFVRPDARLTIKAEFSQTAGLHPGNKVMRLGMPIGKVAGITPHGSTSTVTFTVPASTKLPAKANASIVNPDVISDQYLELSPTYRNGPTLPDGARIPVERTHAPIGWDKLVSTLDTVTKALGPTKHNPKGALGSGLHDMAGALDGKGKKMRDAITSLRQASSLAVRDSPHAKRLLGSLGRLLDVVDKNQASVDSLSGTVTAITDEYQSHQNTITESVGNLAKLMKQASDLVEKYGDRIDGTVHSFKETTQTLANVRYQITGALRYLPLAGQNLSRAVHGNRVRLRIDASTNLQQFATGKQLCKHLPNPLCTGAGLVNPIPGPPPPQLDPLGFLDPRGSK